MERPETTDLEARSLSQASPAIIARAWLDDDFFEGLSEPLKRLIPKSPVGEIDFGVVLRGGQTEKLWAGTVAASCSTVSASCSTVSASCSTVAASCSTVSAHCSTVSATCSTVDAKCSSVAATCSTVAAKCSSIAATCSTVAASCSTVAANCGRRRRRG